VNETVTFNVKTVLVVCSIAIVGRTGIMGLWNNWNAVVMQKLLMVIC